MSAPENVSSSAIERAALADRIEAEAWIDLCEAVPRATREALGLSFGREDGVVWLRAERVPSPVLNRAFAFSSDADESVLDRVIGRFGKGRFGVQLCPEVAKPELQGALERRGFVPAALRSWAKMLRDAAPPVFPETTLTRGPVDASEAERFGRVVCAAHGMPDAMIPWTSATVGRAGWRAFAVRDGGTIVGGGAVYLGTEGAWFGMAGTLPEYRRRGGQGTLMAHRIEAGLEAGKRVFETETGETGKDPSLANMVRAGFVRVSSRLNFEPGPV